MTPAHHPHALPRTQADITAWLTDSIAGITGAAAGDIAPDVPFTRLGLDSAAAVSLTGDLERWLGCRLNPTLLYDYTTIESLAAHLAARPAARSAAGAQPA